MSEGVRKAARLIVDDLIDAMSARQSANNAETRRSTEEAILTLRDKLLDQLGIVQIERNRMALAAAGLIPGSSMEGVPSLSNITRPDHASETEGQNAIRLAFGRMVQDDRRRLGTKFAGAVVAAMRAGVGGQASWLFDHGRKQGVDPTQAAVANLIEQTAAQAGYVSGYAGVRGKELIDMAVKFYAQYAEQYGIEPARPETIRSWLKPGSKHADLFNAMKRDGRADRGAGLPPRSF